MTVCYPTLPVVTPHSRSVTPRSQSSRRTQGLSRLACILLPHAPSRNAALPTCYLGLSAFRAALSVCYAELSPGLLPRTRSLLRRAPSRNATLSVCYFGLATFRAALSVCYTTLSFCYVALSVCHATLSVVTPHS